MSLYSLTPLALELSSILPLSCLFSFHLFSRYFIKFSAVAGLNSFYNGSFVSLAPLDDWLAGSLPVSVSVVPGFNVFSSGETL